MRISDWSSDVCSSDLSRQRAFSGTHVRALAKRIGWDAQRDAVGTRRNGFRFGQGGRQRARRLPSEHSEPEGRAGEIAFNAGDRSGGLRPLCLRLLFVQRGDKSRLDAPAGDLQILVGYGEGYARRLRSEEHTSELQSLMRI